MQRGSVGTGWAEPSYSNKSADEILRARKVPMDWLIFIVTRLFTNQQKSFNSLPNPPSSLHLQKYAQTKIKTALFHRPPPHSDVVFCHKRSDSARFTGRRIRSDNVSGISSHELPFLVHKMLSLDTLSGRLRLGEKVSVCKSAEIFPRFLTLSAPHLARDCSFSTATGKQLVHHGPSSPSSRAFFPLLTARPAASGQSCYLLPLRPTRQPSPRLSYGRRH